jgi:hypothetical protein
MKYFEKISVLSDKNTIRYLPIKLPTSPTKKGKFFKVVSNKIQNLNNLKKGLD